MITCHTGHFVKVFHLLYCHTLSLLAVGCLNTHLCRYSPVVCLSIYALCTHLCSLDSCDDKWKSSCSLICYIMGSRLFRLVVFINMCNSWLVVYPVSHSNYSYHYSIVRAFFWESGTKSWLCDILWNGKEKYTWYGSNNCLLSITAYIGLFILLCSWDPSDDAFDNAKADGTATLLASGFSNVAPGCSIINCRTCAFFADLSFPWIQKLSMDSNTFRMHMCMVALSPSSLALNCLASDGHEPLGHSSACSTAFSILSMSPASNLPFSFSSLKVLYTMTQ